MWKAKIQLSCNLPLEYKYILSQADLLTWESGRNRKLQPLKKYLFLTDVWEHQQVKIKLLQQEAEGRVGITGDVEQLGGFDKQVDMK
jgi:hypothetical protein